MTRPTAISARSIRPPAPAWTRGGVSTWSAPQACSAQSTSAAAHTASNTSGSVLETARGWLCHGQERHQTERRPPSKTGIGSFPRDLTMTSVLDLLQNFHYLSVTD